MLRTIQTTLWTSLPPSQKLAEPTYASFRAAEIPEVTRDGARLRVIAGRVDGIEGPMTLATATTFAHIHLAAGATVSLSVDQKQELGLYVLDGALGSGSASAMGPGTLAILTPGDRVSVSAKSARPVDVALLGGAPAEGPILFSGPFVMDTPERLAQTKRDFSSGKMGTLAGVPF